MFPTAKRKYQRKNRLIIWLNWQTAQHILYVHYKVYIRALSQNNLILRIKTEPVTAGADDATVYSVASAPTMISGNSDYCWDNVEEFKWPKFATCISLPRILTHCMIITRRIDNLTKLKIKEHANMCINKFKNYSDRRKYTL